MKSVRVELLESGVLTNDLIPLLKSIESKKDEQLFDIVLRLLVNLTQSAITCYDRKIPTDKIERNVYLQIDGYLQKAKQSFSDEPLIKILNKKLNEILAKDWKNRPEDEEMIIERILFLLRNMLMIRPGSDDDDESFATSLNSHDTLIW
jgi:timeless